MIEPREWLWCTACDQWLEPGLPDEGPCPKCGKFYSAWVLRQLPEYVGPSGNCPRCEHDVSQLGNNGVCPRCRAQFVRVEQDHPPHHKLLPTCIACGYDLGGLAESGVCPECAAAYDNRPGRQKPLWPEPPGLKPHLWAGVLSFFCPIYVLPLFCVSALFLQMLMPLHTYFGSDFIDSIFYGSVMIFWFVKSAIDIARIADQSGHWGTPNSPWERPSELFVSRGAGLVLAPITFLVWRWIWQETSPSLGILAMP